MDFSALSNEELARYYQTNQLKLYDPVSPEAIKLHKSVTKQVIACGGNRSSKTDTCLVELAIQMTGIIPDSLLDIYPYNRKLKPPIRARIVCNSLTIALETVIKPKLQYWRWNGRGTWINRLGHWGWIPPYMLINGKWEDSYSEKHRLLTLVNGSTCQMFSYDQDLSDFSADSVHLVLEDEAPPKDIHRENLMRTTDVGGRVYMTITPPDDSNLAWSQAWIYDELYERGLGDNKDPNIDTFTFLTLDNKILDPVEISAVVASMTPEQQAARLEGKFLHLSGRVYKEFASRPQYWCFNCKKHTHCIDGTCIACKIGHGVQYCNVVEPFSLKSYNWPVIFAFDPHPRKPHCMAWYAIDPNDDLIQVAELELDADPEEVKKQVDKLEETGGFNVRKRIIDPNMGESPTGVRRGLTVRQIYSDVGLRCDLADDSRDTARTAIRQMLAPDARLKKPRIQVFSTCRKSIYQMNHYSWDEWARYSGDARDPKPRPREKDDDFPTLLGYVTNLQPRFRVYIHENPTGFHIVREWNEASRNRPKRWVASDAPAAR